MMSEIFVNNYVLMIIKCCNCNKNRNILFDIESSVPILCEIRLEITIKV